MLLTPFVYGFYANHLYFFFFYFSLLVFFWLLMENVLISDHFFTSEIFGKNAWTIFFIVWAFIFFVYVHDYKKHTVSRIAGTSHYQRLLLVVVKPYPVLEWIQSTMYKTMTSY